MTATARRPWPLHSPEESGGPNPFEFREAMSRFATGVTVVTARVGDADVAMTASALSSVSVSPPLVLVCIRRHGAFHHSLSAAGQWGVSILGQGARSTAERLARPGRGSDQLSGIGHHPGTHVDCVLLDDALATLECRTVAVYPGGDHSIFLGRVERTVVDRHGREPLLHFTSRFMPVEQPARAPA